MGRRRGYKMTDAEMMKCEYNEPCPRCKSRKTFVVSNDYYGCHECRNEWGWHDKHGSQVSRAEYRKRVEKTAVQSRFNAARDQALDAPGEESDMAKSKKAAKGAGKKPVAKRKTAKTAKRKTTEAGLSMCGFIREFAKKNPKATGEDIAKATKTAVGVLPATATVIIQANKGRKG